jgi:hypothetical protein
MTVEQRMHVQDNERERLLRRMEAAKVSENRQDINNALAEAKRRVGNNYAGDNPIRKAQARLLGVFPPEH